MKFQCIVVGVDGSSNSAAAVGWAADVAGATGAEVIAVHTLGLLDRLEGDTVPSQPNRVAIGHQFESEWCAPLDRPDVQYRALLRDGPPESVLLAVADEVDADLVVVGSRGLGGYPQLLLGSTSTQVAQHSRRPVTIVPMA